jgi:hypothetical protein
VEQRDLTFVIPTYRLRDVGETLEQYDQDFWRNGHSVRIIGAGGRSHERSIRSAPGHRRSAPPSSCSAAKTERHCP